jgi:hypothetical protein
VKVSMRWGLTILAIILIGPAVARAETIGPDCGSCQGSIYTLSASWVGGDATKDVWRVTLTIDTSTYSGGGIATAAVAIKVSSSTVHSELFSVPDDLKNWELIAGGLNAKGCSGKGSGFDCADWVAFGPGISLEDYGPLLIWQFDQTIPKGTLFQGIGAGDIASIKVMYTDANGNKVGALVSENVNVSVPEASLTLLLGIGLFAVGLLAVFSNSRRSRTGSRNT